MKKIVVRFSSFCLTIFTVIFAVAPAVFAVVGDVDGNGKTQAGDARAILRHSAKLSTLSAAQLAKADINYDGKINSADARGLLRAVARLCSLENFDQYYMHAKFTNSATGSVTELDTAWQNGRVLIKISDDTMLIYDASGTVTMINHRKKQYSEMSFEAFQKQYPGNAAYFANGAKALCWSENLPTPLYLEDQGFNKRVTTTGGVTRYIYKKDFRNGAQIYTFDESRLPVKSEFYADGSLMTLDFLAFDRDPTFMFTEYKNYRKG